MAKGRTGLSLIRTGNNAVAVGLGLLAGFGTDSAGWTIFNLALMAGGLVLITDGLRASLKIRSSTWKATSATT
jgi:hypothetical protein